MPNGALRASQTDGASNVLDATIGEDSDLPDGMWGCYDPDMHVITFARGLDRVEQRCTQAHEEIHAERRDEPATGTPWNDWYDEKREAAVEAEAARRLIPLPALIDALRWSNRDEEVAEQLDVDLDTLRCRSANLTSEECSSIEGALYDEWSSA